MASLDFVYDLVEKFDEEKINYLVVSLRAGKAEDKVDVFFNVEPENEPTFSVAIDQIKEILEAKITVIINAMGSILNAYDRLITIGIKMITVALLVKKLVNIVTNINKLHSTNDMGLSFKKNIRFFAIS